MIIVLMATTGRLLCLDNHILFTVFNFPNWFKLVHPCLVTSKTVCKLPLVELWKIFSNCLSVCTPSLFFVHLSRDDVSIWQKSFVLSCTLLSCCSTIHIAYRISLVSLNNTGIAGLGGSVGQASDWLSGGCGVRPLPGQHYSFVQNDHEIFSTAIIAHPLI